MALTPHPPKNIFFLKNKILMIYNYSECSYVINIQLNNRNILHY